MKSVIYRITGLALLTSLAVSCSKDSVIPAANPAAVSQSADATATRESNLAMGNPSGATTSTTNYTNYLLTKSQFSMSYHRDRGIPNWVSWHLSSAWLGSTPRQDNFAADATLPSGWYRVGSTSYSGSGFDRGHNCPSADRTSTLEDNSATFLMTNMMPQTGDNNQGPWAALESYTRTFLPSNEVYVICGSYGVGGGAGGLITSIDQGRVTVPKRTWKVIVILPVGDNDVARISATTRVIAVDMPNTTGIRETNWGTFRTSVDAIEEATGYDLLSKLPLEVQAALESKVDAGPAL